MYNKAINTILAIAISIIALFSSCNKEEYPLSGTGRYHSEPMIESVKSGDPLAYTFDERAMRFIDGQLEDSFVPVVMYEDGPVKGQRVSERFSLEAKAMVQYIEPKTENFSETEGTTIELKTSVLDHNNGWVENKGGKVYSWNAINIDDVADCPYTYRDSVWTSSSVYTFVPKDNLSGYEVTFPATDMKVEAGEKKTEEVDGVAYNGKTWNALKVSYPSVVTMTIPEEFRMKGEQYEMALDATNIVYYLRHVVNSQVENMSYEVNILENGLKIEKEYQTLTFDLVTRDNGEVKNSVSYKLEESFDITAVKVEDVEVFSEDALKNTQVNLTKGNITSTTEVEDIFTKVAYTGADKATMADSRSTDIAISYVGYAWGSEEFPYASVIGRKAELESVENAAETTASKKVYDVTLTLSYDITYNNSDKTDETKVIVITYKRFYNVPDEFSQTVTATNFELQYVQPDESQMGTSVQRNTVTVTKYNHGEYESESSYVRDIALSAKLSRTSAAKVQVKEAEPITANLKAKGGYTTTFGQKDAQGIQTMTVSRKYEIKTSDGATYELVVSDERDRKEGEDFGHHAEFNDAAFEPVIALQPTLNNAASSENEEVYDVKVSVSMPINRTDKVATKAGNDADIFTVTASHQEVKGDEYVEGKDRTVWTVTPNGNGCDITGQLFETYTISGERLVDTQVGRMSASNVGREGSSIVVDNTNFVNNGQGHNGTGNGVYSSPARNGNETVESLYDWSADGSLTLTLKGEGGKGASKTFTGSFVISEAGQTITGPTVGNGYEAYQLVNKTNGLYTVEGQSVTIPASVENELRVVKTLVGNLLSVGMTVVPAHAEGNGFADGNGKQYATICMTLVKKDGSAAPIVYAQEEAGKCQLPTDEQISGAKFFAGSYDETYNSGLYVGEWVPAVGKDEGWGISYAAPEYGKTRSIRNETLNKMWGWRGGNLSVNLADYRCEVVDGVCTISYGANIVMQFK